jgi:hypothetical protein
MKAGDKIFNFNYLDSGGFEMLRFILNATLAIIFVASLLTGGSASAQSPSPTPTPTPGEIPFIGIFQSQPPAQGTSPPEYLIAYRVPNTTNKYAGQADDPVINPDGTVTHNFGGLVAGTVINLSLSLPPPSGSVGVVCTLVCGGQNNQCNQDESTGLYHCATYDDPTHNAPPP